MEITILGTGCPKCRSLEKEVKNVLAETGMEAEVMVEHDIMKIMEYGMLRTPGLVVDGKLMVSGRVPGKEELVKIFTL